MVAESHRKKKSSSKGKSKLVTVMAMKEILISIPKGPFKYHLEKIGQLKDIHFERYMSIAEVNQLLSDNFINLGSDIQFQYLKPHRNNRLTVLGNQELNGTELVELARSGKLYLKILPSKSAEVSQVSIN